MEGLGEVTMIIHYDTYFFILVADERTNYTHGYR